MVSNYLPYRSVTLVDISKEILGELKEEHKQKLEELKTIVDKALND